MRRALHIWHGLRILGISKLMQLDDLNMVIWRVSGMELVLSQSSISLFVTTSSEPEALPL